MTAGPQVHVLYYPSGRRHAGRWALGMLALPGAEQSHVSRAAGTVCWVATAILAGQNGKNLKRNIHFLHHLWEVPAPRQARRKKGTVTSPKPGQKRPRIEASSLHHCVERRKGQLSSVPSVLSAGTYWGSIDGELWRMYQSWWDSTPTPPHSGKIKELWLSCTFEIENWYYVHIFCYRYSI